MDHAKRPGLGAASSIRWSRTKTLGDGFVATFDGPARAVRCAQGIVEELHELGVSVRCGLHTGECELLDSPHSTIAGRTRCIGAGDRVVVEVLQRGKGRASGAVVEGRFWFVYTIAEGQIIRQDVFDTRAQAFEAAGLRGP